MSATSQPRTTPQDTRGVEVRRDNAWSYLLDGDDVILETCDTWDAFALENDGAAIVSAGITGSSLWTHVHDGETRQLLRHLLAETRKRQRSLVDIPFRCDGPRVRRYMRCTFEPAGTRRVRVHTTLDREESRAVAAPVPDGAGPRPGELMHVCSWCNRIREGLDQWLEVDEAIRLQRPFMRPPLAAISHGMCQDCLAAVEADLSAEEAAASLQAASP